ncbi:hypothetical protein CLOAM0581 [Candidatus Cloacimonas acidaminovorans str. Evry]|uniref:Uncharacterized protein n=1 Tax=Cloacimonas acidaminovorans (strain Evry) TaxID=459349 RepID=B0VGM9_CLOAI|nr:hypothetical protein CLOAM0581 [Candidatus Cloacimonas acidaminovorans str. Evry]
MEQTRLGVYNIKLLNKKRRRYESTNLQTPSSTDIFSNSDCCIFYGKRIFFCFNIRNFY